MTNAATYRNEKYQFSLQYPHDWRIVQRENIIYFDRPMPRPLRFLEPLLYRKFRPHEYEAALTVQLLEEKHVPGESMSEWIRRALPKSNFRNSSLVAYADSKWAEQIVSEGETQKNFSQSAGLTNVGWTLLLVRPFRPEILETFRYQYEGYLELDGPDYKQWMNDQSVTTDGWKSFTSEAVRITVKYPKEWEVKVTPDETCVQLLYESNGNSRGKKSAGYVSLCDLGIYGIKDYLRGVGYELSDEAILQGKVLVHDVGIDPYTLDVHRINLNSWPSLLLGTENLLVQKNRSLYEFHLIGSDLSMNNIVNTIVNSVSFIE